MNLNKILYWALVIFITYLIIEILRKIFGGSWGFEEILSSLVLANLGYTFYMNSEIHHRFSEVNSRISEVNAKFSEHIGWHKGKNDDS